MRILKKVWTTIGTIVVVIIVLLAVSLVGVRIFGFRVLSVLSGSMEPTYHVGSLIYVKNVDPEDVKVGDPITFVLDENLTVATHRVVEINIDEDGTIRYTTKGDANDAVDGTPVHEKNLLGVPVFTIPYLGYVANFIQHPPGIYIAIAGVAIILILLFLPDLLGGDNKKQKKKRKRTSV